jgi:hypothetical protein
VVNAAEIPVLAGLLGKAGWTTTPELSGVFQVGRIFKDDGTGHSLMVRDCFEAEPGSAPAPTAPAFGLAAAGCVARTANNKASNETVCNM